ncbi:hypothetical protein M8J77_023578 [Diaphorina citri]|nr:hypothetical protein M8J77_023578 [Diaphorina citri]
MCELDNPFQCFSKDVDHSNADNCETQILQTEIPTACQYTPLEILVFKYSATVTNEFPRVVFTGNFFCLGRRRRHGKARHSSPTSRLNNENKTLNNNSHKANNHDTESTLSRTSSSNNLCFVFHPCGKSNQSRHEFNMTSLKKSSNHYTVDESYQHPVYGDGDDPVYQIEEAVYTELDGVPHSTSTPAYQNTGFLQCDIEHTSSAPSSAYYSDFSESTNTRQYECIGDPLPPAPTRNATKSQLSVINETLHNVPSDYI